MTQQTAGGRIVPFPMAASYVRRKALENRREGRLPEAAELFRRGAEMDEGGENLLDLARVLADMGCPEQAARALERLIILEPANACAYYELALMNLRLGRRDAACDCAANCVMLAPDTPLAEEAHEIMEQLAQSDELPPSKRQGVLLRRGAEFQRKGEKEKARRAFERALKASRKAPAMRCTLGALYLEQGAMGKALVQVEKALKRMPDYLPAHILRCLTLERRGCHQLAVRLLEALSRREYGNEQTELLCRTARQVGGEKQALRFLQRQLRRSPYSIRLLEEAALSCWRLGRIDRAEKLWQRILHIDPANDSAKICMGMAEKGCHEPPREAGLLPHREMMERLKKLTVALSLGQAGFMEAQAETPRWESVIRWAFTLPPCGLHQPLLKALEAWPRWQREAFLKPLLLDHSVAEETRRQIVYHLIAAGHEGPLLMLYGCHLTQVEAQTEANVPNGWKRFLHAYLPECCDVPDAAGAVGFAARCWRALLPEQRMDAAGERSYAWVMAVKLLALEKAGFIELENEMAARLPISVRRVERLMDLIERQMALKEAPTHEADRL